MFRSVAAFLRRFDTNVRVFNTILDGILVKDNLLHLHEKS